MSELTAQQEQELGEQLDRLLGGFEKTFGEKAQLTEVLAVLDDRLAARKKNYFAGALDNSWSPINLLYFRRELSKRLTDGVSKSGTGDSPNGAGAAKSLPQNVRSAKGKGNSRV